MADTKLSLLTELAVTPADTDEFYINDGGVSKRITYGTIKADFGQVANPLSQFAATTSAQLAGVMSDETGTGALVFATSPTLVTPALGTPVSGDLSNCTNYPAPEGTAVLSTGPVTDGYVLTADGAGAAAWEAGGGAPEGTAVLSTGVTDGYVLTADGADGSAWEAAGGGGFTSIVDDETNGNYAIGLNALDSVTVGVAQDCIAIGENAGTANTTGDDNIYIGTNAGLLQATGSDNVFIGTNCADAGEALFRNVGIGVSVLSTSTGGADNTAIGYQAGLVNVVGDDNVYIGKSAGGTHTQNDGVCIGKSATPGTATDSEFVLIGSATQGGNDSVAVGFQSQYVATGDRNTTVGWKSGDSITTGTENICFGYDVDVADAAGVHQIAIGDAIVGYMSARTDLDYSANKLTITGTSAYTSATTNQDGGDLELRPGQPASGGGTKGTLIIDGLNWPAADGTDGQVVTTDGAGNLAFEDAGGGGFTTIVDRETDGTYGIGSGVLAASIATAALKNIAFGTDAGAALASGDGNVMIGDNAGDSLSNGARNVLIGEEAGAGLTSNSGNNIGLGYRAGGGASGGSGADYNIAIGTQSLEDVQGDNNIGIGRQAGADITSGSDNVLVAPTGAGNNLTTGGRNLMLVTGDSIAFPSNTANNQVIIGITAGTAFQTALIAGTMGPDTDVDISSADITITGPSAQKFATTNLSGGDLIVRGGLAKAAGAGVGGELYLRGGTGGDTGSDGLVMMDNLPTSDPAVAGALWNNSNVLNISTG